MAPRTSLALFLFLNLLFFTYTSAQGTCPLDSLQIDVCVNALNLVNLTLGTPVQPCCSIIKGLVELDAAACLCTALHANILGIDLINLPISLRLLLSGCGGTVPQGFQCV
ncbi:unnamed protein product [Eruca vesicaria subsp. sativa]|uniref:Hydrophobic seed protein domain-containing protein n=1 Tax=Eruca vesicaria subsp. sativa TaxID=29727 RepID=A0ABC8L9N1_ERUVS|nr:unnamed protein product [Eruca vesicaria subsp. sativa]CAH8378246.1 unnamed protein product [Eruca vesicaria subsp. sativa]